jgi:hypothetical protein
VRVFCVPPLPRVSLYASEFQRLYTPNAFRDERAVWRSVVQLNLVRSIRIILDAIFSVDNARAARIDSGGEDDGDSDEEHSLETIDDVCMLAERLAHLRTLESALISKLVPSEEGGEPTRLPTHGDRDEVFVRPGTKWKGKFALRPSGKSASTSFDSSRPSSPGYSLSEDDIATALHAARLDMLSLWHHTSTKEVLRRKKIRPEESPGLFVSFRLLLYDWLTPSSAFWTT